MVLLVLAVVWVVALTPMVLRKLSERRLVTSVTSFSRHIGRLRSHAAGGAPMPSRLVPIGFSAAAQRIHVEHRVDSGAQSGRVSPDHEVIPVFISRATTARRRRVLLSLAGGTVGCFLFGLVPALGFLSNLALVGIACIAVYVALLVYFRRLAVERAQKVVALETRRHVVSALDRARAGGGVQAVAGASGPSGAGWMVTGAHQNPHMDSGRRLGGARFESRELVGAGG
ncbi:MAG: hypothetical protein M0Z69_09155 [Actinomycetota bacterium]|nr:hypothetical protein [Actinomycetota bacterium]